MQPEEKAVLDLLQSWSPDVTGLLHRAGYFDLPEGTAKDEIASKIGFGRGTPLYKRLQAASLEKNWQVAKIVLDEQNLIELKQGARGVAKQLGLSFSEFDWDPISQKFMKEEGFKLVKTLTQTDLKRIEPIIQQHFGLNEKTFARRFRDNYPCSEYRMKTIFRTEKFTAINAGADGLAREAGATTKTWRHSHGPNPRKDHLAMDGETVGIDEAFSNGKQYPSDPNCRCRVDYGFGDGTKAWRAKAQARMVGSRAPEARQVAPIGEGRKVAEFVPAKSKEEIRERMRPFLREGGSFEIDLPLQKMNSILKASEDTLGKYNTQVDFIGWETKAGRNYGRCNQARAVKGEPEKVSIYIRKSYAADPVKYAEKDIVGFKNLKKNKLESLERYGTTLKSMPPGEGVNSAIADNARKIKNLKLKETWCAGDTHPDPLYCTFKHESYHAIDFPNAITRLNNAPGGMTSKFEIQLKAHDAMGIPLTEYASGSSSELFAELGTAIDIGMPVNPKLKAAFEATMKELK